MLNLQKNIDLGIKLILTSLEMRIVQCEQALTQFIEQNMEITSMYMLEVDWYLLINLSKQQILDASKLKEFADDNFKFDEKGRKFSKREENIKGKGEIARFKQFLLFPQCF